MSPSIVAQQERHNEGVRLFFAGAPISACKGAEQRNGWLTANAVYADAETETWLVEHADEPSIEDDYEWIRRGC